MVTTELTTSFIFKHNKHGFFNFPTLEDYNQVANKLGGIWTGPIEIPIDDNDAYELAVQELDWIN